MTAARGRTKLPSRTPFLPQTRSGREEAPPQPASASRAKGSRSMTGRGRGIGDLVRAERSRQKQGYQVRGADARGWVMSAPAKRARWRRHRLEAIIRRDVIEDRP